MIYDKDNLMVYDFDLTGFPDSTFKKVERFSDYEETPGVWACLGQNSDNEWVCLNVGSSKTIGKEMRVDFKCSKGNFKHKEGVYKNYLGKEVFTFDRPMNEPITIRERVWDDIGKKYNNLVFVIVSLSDEENARLKVEKKYALKYKAKYWNEAPKQRKKKD